MPPSLRSLAGRAAPVGARITGLGAAQPDTVVGGAALVAPFGKAAEWLRARTGIEQLRRLAPGERLDDLTAVAARRALDDAHLAPGDLDAVVVATCTDRADPMDEYRSEPGPSGQRCPPAARRLADRLAVRTATLDVNAVCAGFCYALAAAADLIAVGTARAVLVVGADQMSTVIDPGDLGTSILFGDGAGAAVVTATADGSSGVGPLAAYSDGGREALLRIPPGEKFLHMAGREVFRWAVEEVHQVAAAACAKAGIRPADVDVFVPHQANLRIVEAMARRLGIDTGERGRTLVARDVVESGNTSGASIPIALAKLRQAGRTRTGQVALLVGFGAGLSAAAQVVTLP